MRLKLREALQALQGKRFGVWNITDDISVTHMPVTRKQARKIIREFPVRFEAQGYYLTASGLRIDPTLVELQIHQIQ